MSVAVCGEVRESLLLVVRLQRLRSERDHLQFPDEVDTPADVLAKVRFQK